MSDLPATPADGGLPGASMLPPAAPPRPARPARPARPRQRGRFDEINTFVDCTMRGLTPAARAVWLVLWRDTKPDGQARAGQADIAHRAGVTDRAVRTALRELVAAGLVRVVRPGRAGAGVTAYRVRAANPAGA